MPVDPFSLDPSPSLTGRAAAYVARPLLSWLGLGELHSIYRSLPDGPDDTFIDRVLAALDVTVDVHGDDLARIPASGPLILAANHPRGGLDGLVLATVMRRVRPDGRLLANFLLSRVPELRASCFFVDPFGGTQAAARSRAGLRAAHLWLRGGGALGMFPAGEVAPTRSSGTTVTDSAWATTLNRLAAATGATVVPVFIDGVNSNAFYRAGRVHARLRTALLPRELLRARGTRVSVQVGAPLRGRDASVATVRARSAIDGLAATTTIAREVAALPAGARLVGAGRFDVYCARAAGIPHTLEDIGRLRAVAYRAAGEGTGRAIDLDAFDRHYLHLFVWDREARQVAGAYRIARTDAIVDAHGVAGLYTRTLFTYDANAIEAMSPALELGRSFVRPEYQRDHHTLLLLWRGIGEFVVRHPHYRVLFGPVTISPTYSAGARALLTSYLTGAHLHRGLAPLIQARRPQATPTPRLVAPLPTTVPELDRMVAGLEADGKRMPVLLRQYLKLNAQAIAFSVDPGFGGALDALMMVDLPRVDPMLLQRYLGRDGAAAYLAHHRRGSLSPAA